jgi:hypothetical protein
MKIAPDDMNFKTRPRQVKLNGSSVCLPQRDH